MAGRLKGKSPHFATLPSYLDAGRIFSGSSRANRTGPMTSWRVRMATRRPQTALHALALRASEPPHHTAVSDQIPSAVRRHRTSLLVSAGVVWLLVLLALLAWWLLPRWAPNFVIRYSPMPDMVFRAAIDGNGASQTAEARLIAMGRDATEVMIAQLHHADERACALALTVLGGTKDHRAIDAVIAENV